MQGLGGLIGLALTTSQIEMGIVIMTNTPAYYLVACNKTQSGLQRNLFYGGRKIFFTVRRPHARVPGLHAKMNVRHIFFAEQRGGGGCGAMLACCPRRCHSGAVATADVRSGWYSGWHTCV